MPELSETVQTSGKHGAHSNGDRMCKLLRGNTEKYLLARNHATKINLQRFTVKDHFHNDKHAKLDGD